MRVIPISELAIGEEGIVRAITANGFLRERLLELGLVAGTHIRCERIGPSGKVCVYEVRASRIVIRRCDGDHVLAEVY